MGQTYVAQHRITIKDVRLYRKPEGRSMCQVKNLNIKDIIDKRV